MGGLWSPCVYLAPLWRYSVSNVGRTDVDMQRMKKEGKKKEEGEGEGRERGRGRKREGEGGRKIA